MDASKYQMLKSWLDVHLHSTNHDHLAGDPFVKNCKPILMFQNSRIQWSKSKSSPGSKKDAHGILQASSTIDTNKISTSTVSEACLVLIHWVFAEFHFKKVDHAIMSPCTLPSNKNYPLHVSRDSTQSIPTMGSLMCFPHLKLPKVWSCIWRYARSKIQLKHCKTTHRS